MPSEEKALRDFNNGARSWRDRFGNYHCNWPHVNDVKVVTLCDGEKANCDTDNFKTFNLLVKRDGKWMLWDRIEASSHEAATDYFAGKYPSEKRSVRLRK